MLTGALESSDPRPVQESPAIDAEKIHDKAFGTDRVANSDSIGDLEERRCSQEDGSEESRLFFRKLHDGCIVVVIGVFVL